MSEYVVTVEKMRVQIGGHTILENLTLEIPPNAFVTIVGPNGAGKSTFLKVLLNLVEPAAGKVLLFGQSPRTAPPEWIGYVPQIKTIARNFPALSIELVITGLSRQWPWRITKTTRNQAILALEQVGAAHLANRQLAKLSGGELQRIFLARTIVRQPRLIILDEPATGIDVVGEADMYRQLEAYQQQSGATLIMVTHDWHAATHHANLVLLLNRQQISFGPPKDALNEDNLRLAYGHIGHKHSLKFLTRTNGK